ncbi:uncharacterized protein GGS22DRAFT_49860 [Annulohypoxylon maeteangense]|uniref:uncharacterized protein n=1 Tax=Annulohypoxylon maeteangense TaxID=1927788 RepID=UPI0020074516|nr:uncharacterized protein GGS22DRAFT_49860 [Annulohypoxylon maeteangense]KAI0882282.1 hypothetical protein GGS22DRAFT_49860 [Annulohypoxylon maeteangense]
MSLQTVRNVVLLFSNPSWSDGHSIPSTILRNITALSRQIAYSEDLLGNVTTLSTTSVSTANGVVQGLLYVPDLAANDPCQNLTADYIPKNVTRQVNLPTTNYNLIALAPWINTNCTRSFLSSARLDPIRGMLVYRPDDDDTNQPPDADDDVWNLGDGNAWKAQNRYPVYAIPGSSGNQMMRQLSLYSGDLSTVPFSDQIISTYSPNPADYVRVWTELSVITVSTTLPLWAFILIILGVIISVIGSTSLLMHFVQSRRRAALRGRVERGEVNLEALGIKRLRVPLTHIQTFPLFTYNYDPPIPTSPTSPKFSKGRRSSEASRQPINMKAEKTDAPINYQPACLICLEDFESKKTIIRELSCGHIFHPECIDEFLSQMSSLCPSCKASMLPPGYCPEITNSMVRREFGTRRLRSRGGAIIHVDVERGRERLSSWSSTMKKHICRVSSPKPEEAVDLPEQRPRIERQSTVGTARDRMQDLVVPVDETNSDDGRPQWKRTALKVFPGFR